MPAHVAPLVQPIIESTAPPGTIHIAHSRPAVVAGMDILIGFDGVWLFRLHFGDGSV